VPKAARFCRNLLAVYPALWTFARVEGVEPTNNRAERTLRPAVLWRKISLGNPSEAGCRFAERILTTVQTLRLQKRHVLTYLRQAVIAHRAGQPAPALIAVAVRTVTKKSEILLLFLREGGYYYPFKPRESERLPKGVRQCLHGSVFLEFLLG
jgi:hypothetical protein